MDSQSQRRRLQRNNKSDSNFMELNDFIKDEIVKRLQKLNPLKILIFGSFVYGKPTKDSDIDLLIVKEKLSSKIRETVEARKALKGILMPFDTIVASLEEFDFYKDQINTVYFEADKKGLLLYERK